MNNFTILKNGTPIVEANTINWLSTLAKEGVGKKFETSPAIGYYLAADFKVPDITSLDLSNFNKSDLKTSWTFMSGQITSVEKISREVINFSVAEDTFEVVVNNLNNTPKPKTTPVSYR